MRAERQREAMAGQRQEDRLYLSISKAPR